MCRATGLVTSAVGDAKVISVLAKKEFTIAVLVTMGLAFLQSHSSQVIITGNFKFICACDHRQ